LFANCLTRSRRIPVGSLRSSEYSTEYAFNADQTAVRTLARYDIAPINVAGVEVLTAVTLA
jgi:hypothetical protein